VKPRTVLIISDYEDVHADAVIEALNHAGRPVYRLNTSDFAIHSTITLGVSAEGSGSIHGKITNSLRRLRADGVRAVWYRRPRPLKLNSLLEPTARPYAQEQFQLALRYLEGVLGGRWVNHPLANRRADNHILQLSTARRLGLAIPETLLTNDPGSLQRFRTRHRGRELIVKDLDLSVASAKVLMRGVATQRLPPDYVVDPEVVRAAPVVVQPFIPKAYELRCTVIGDGVYCARIDTPNIGHLDWRNAYDTGPDGAARDLNRYSPHELASGARDQLVQLVREFGLRFAAVDLIVTPAGELVFLELNPNGQWLWLQRAGLPLIEAMVEELRG
jgi:glutathione synthase/RimK-type ligase-like ATP-grasp enzyme